MFQAEINMAEIKTHTGTPLNYKTYTKNCQHARADDLSQSIMLSSELLHKRSHQLPELFELMYVQMGCGLTVCSEQHSLQDAKIVMQVLGQHKKGNTTTGRKKTP